MVQQVRKSITTLIFFVAFSAAWAQAPRTPLALKPDAPDRYVVVPGDTLWGISTKYTDSPWRWPELWGMNRQQIQNPHLIYPGMVLFLDRARGTLSIGAPATGTVPGAATAAGVPGGTVKLTPRVRAESLAKEQIPSIPPSAIEPFLSRPLVIEPDGLDKAPTIIGTERDRVILSAGFAAYVRGIGDGQEPTWYVYRRGDALIDPDTNRTLAYEAIYLGTARITPFEPAGKPDRRMPLSQAQTKQREAEVVPVDDEADAAPPK